MSDHSGDMEMEELVGDADMSEWVIFEDPIDEEKKHQPVIEDLDQKESKAEDMINKTAMMIVGKLRDLPKGTLSSSLSGEKQDGGSSSTVDQSRENSKRDTTGDSKSRSTKTKSTTDKSKSKATDVVLDDIGDIAGVIGNIDVNIAQVEKTTLNAPKGKKPPKGSKKRKPSSDHYPDSHKTRKTGNKSEIISTKDNSSVTVSKDKPHKQKDDKNKDSPVESKAAKKNEELVLTEEDLRNIDLSLAEEMMDNVRKEMIPSGGESYTVRFSPVELADLAEVSVQELIQAQPNIGFYFKRQGKFKKKKGYAEAYFYYSQDVQSFVCKLTHLKLVERCIEVTITGFRGKKETDVLSFSIGLDKNKRLVELAKNTQDSSRAKSGKTYESFHVEKVPVAASILTLRMLFPYAVKIVMPSDKEKIECEPGFKGPVHVHYRNHKLMKAVLECCYDFSFRGYVLNISHTNKETDVTTKGDLKSGTEIKKDVGVIQERRISAQDNTKQQSAFNEDGGNDKAEASPDKNALQDISGGGDDDISSMTLDVCAGMLESLNKLKKLGTDNPNVLKILEMQNQLATLQKSLSQPNKENSASSTKEDSELLFLNSSNLHGDKYNQEGQQQGQEQRLSKEEKMKQKDETRADKERREMEDLQRKLEEADEGERQKEERDKQMREKEMQRMREVEQRRRASWAKKMLEEFKKGEEMPPGDSQANKQEAQMLLKAIEDKKQEAQRLEEEKLKAEEIAKAAEKERINVENLERIKNEIKEELASLEESPQTSDALDSQKSKEKSEATCSSSQQNSVPVYTEKEYRLMCSTRQTLPEDYYVQVVYFMNRQCPAAGCPSTKFFKTEDSFIDHWENFHKPNVTVRFCQHCSAYFMNVPELESHLTKRHLVNDSNAVKKLLAEARVKVVANPSFRDPGRFLPPVTL